MKFKPDNKIPFMQDHCFCRGIPPDIDFTVEEYSPGNCRLSAYGYGALGKGGNAYGNGALFVKMNHLTGDWSPDYFEIKA